MTPCATPGCPTPTNQGRCPTHQRKPHTARTYLPWLIERDNNICQLCMKPIEGGRGQGGQYASVEHADGDPSNNQPRNLLLAHQNCNKNKEPGQPFNQGR